MSDDPRLPHDLGIALRDLLEFIDWPHARREADVLPCVCVYCVGWRVVDQWQTTLPSFEDVRGILK